MFKITLKEIRSYAKVDVLNQRLENWQKEHNTTGVPDAYALNLECIAYAAGVNGCNGHLYRDRTTGELLGMPHRNEFIYIV